jgi:hypothetical protein
MLPFILYWQPTMTALPRGAILILILSGIASMGAMVFYLNALRAEDVTVVAPLFQITPIFVFVLGYIALGETISLIQSFGAAFIMLGAGILSWAGRRSAFKFRLVALMVLCTATLAAATVLFKIFAVRAGYWSTTFWTYAGEAVFGFCVVLVPAYRRQLHGLFRAHSVALLALNGTNELINLAGALGTRYALLLAPMGLVQAIGSTTSLFVFLFGLALAGWGRGADATDLSGATRVRSGLGVTLVTVGTVLCVVGAA